MPKPLYALTDIYYEEPVPQPLPVDIPRVYISGNVGTDNIVRPVPDYVNPPEGNAVAKLTGNEGERYQLWPEKIIREGLTAAGKLMEKGSINPGLRREDYTDIPAPDMPTKDSTWLGKKLNIAPVAWGPQDKIIEDAQAMSALAGSGGLAGGAEGAALNATPSLRPALRYKDRLYKGKEGQQHLDVIPEQLYPDFQKKAMSGEDIKDYNFGFINDKGQFLTREAALEYGINTGLIDPQAGKYGALTSTLMADSSKPGTAIEAVGKAGHSWWHGSASGDLRGGSSGLHLGTKKAATQALEARIGIPADGKGWTGNREYGKTLLAGLDTLKKMDPKGYNLTGHNARNIPKEDYYPTEIKKYPDGTDMPMTVKPEVAEYRLKGGMSNTPDNPHDDFKANGYMRGQLKRGNAKNGYYYKNVGEDSGSISLTVPSGSHIEKILKADSSKEGAALQAVKPDWKIKGFEDYNDWFHGTTHTFDKFSLAKGNPENYLGKSPHFTNSSKDASANYAGMGPDLTSRIENLAETIAQKIADKKYGGEMGDNYGKIMTQAKQLAKEKLAGEHEGAVVPVNLKLENPISTVDSRPTWLDFNAKLDKDGEWIKDSPLLIKLSKSLEKQAEKYDFDPKKVMEDLGDNLYDEVKASDFDKALRNNEALIYAEDRKTGKLVSSDIIANIYKDMGFDGIVMDAKAAFPHMKDIPDGTLHAAPLKRNTVQSKITGQTLYNGAQLPAGYQLIPVEHNPFEDK